MVAKTIELMGEDNVGIGTPSDIIGQRGKIFPDILAAYHYPNVSNLETSTYLPKVDPTFIKVS